MPALPFDANQTPVTAEQHRDNVGNQASFPRQICRTVPTGQSIRADTSFKHNGVEETTGVLFVEQLQRAMSRPCPPIPASQFAPVPSPLFILPAPIFSTAVRTVVMYELGFGRSILVHHC
ncbi:hypothetical protein C8R46DRAFT_1037710 [Mycena filopes]|nr:hypothetical protein C8R46DRAFT_1037710 [Mycena filopes]